MLFILVSCVLNESFCIYLRFLFVGVSNQSSTKKTNSVPSS